MRFISYFLSLKETTKKNLKKTLLNFRRLSASDKIALLALLLSIISFAKSCQQEKVLNKAQYKQAQLEFRPLIKVIKSEIKEYKLVYDKKQTEVKSLDEFLLADTNEVKDIEAKLEISVSFYLTNIGEASAKIVGQIYTDTTSGDQYLKNNLKKIINNFKKEDIIEDYFSDVEINPGDTLVLDRNIKVNFFKNNKFTVHNFLLYENDLNQLFDTYYWARFKNNEIRMRQVYIPKDHIIVLQARSDDLANAIELVDQHYYTNIYSEKEKKEIRKLLNKLPH